MWNMSLPLTVLHSVYVLSNKRALKDVTQLLCLAVIESFQNEGESLLQTHLVAHKAIDRINKNPQIQYKREFDKCRLFKQITFTVNRNLV